MRLNLSFEDLASVLSVCFLMAKIDDNFSKEECNAILDTLCKQYNFEGKDDLLKDYVEYANKMDFKEVVRRISAFGPNEKLFLAEMLAKTMAADGKITSDEDELYKKCMEAFSLPDPTAFGVTTVVDNNEIAPTFLSIGFTCYNRNLYYGDICTHQMPSGKNFQLWLFDYMGAKTITKWTETTILKILTEKMHLLGGRKLAMIQSDRDKEITSPNKIARMLSNGTDIRGDVNLCLWTPDNKFAGFTDKSDLIWLVNAIDTIFEGNSLTDGSDAVKYPNENEKHLNFALDRINKLS